MTAQKKYKSMRWIKEATEEHIGGARFPNAGGLNATSFSMHVAIFVIEYSSIEL